jgi:hypothetical protein
MPARNTSPFLSRQTAELALAVPQVVTHRMLRMAMAGPLPNARDRREFQAMGREKVNAFWQSWFAMGWAVTQAWQQGCMAMLQGAPVALLDVGGVLSKGLAPVHRQATANARRLARVTLR